MASSGPLNLSYERLKQEISFEEDEFGPAIGRYHLRGSVFHHRRVHIRRRLRVKIPSLRRFLSRKARALKAAWLKMYKRLKESQAHFGDIFAGNYLFMQVTPTPLKYSSVDYHNKPNFVYNHKDLTVSRLSSTSYSLAA